MKISSNFDKESAQAFQEGCENLLILHIAVNMLFYRGLDYPFVSRGMSLFPVEMQTTGDLCEVLGEEHTIRRDGWRSALKRCSRATVSFFRKRKKQNQFSVQVRLFERGSQKPFYAVDMSIKSARFHDPGPDCYLDSSLKFLANDVE